MELFAQQFFPSSIQLYLYNAESQQKNLKVLNLYINKHNYITDNNHIR